MYEDMERSEIVEQESVEVTNAQTGAGTTSQATSQAAGQVVGESAPVGAKPAKVKGSRKARKVSKGKKEGELTAQGKLLLGVGTAILAVTLIMCVFLMLPSFLGIKTYLVASGSMEPTIPVGSMIYAKEVNPVNLEVDDIIVFLKKEADNVPITHRVVSNDKDAKTIITKGVNNANADPNPIQYNNVIGRVIWHTPGLGILTGPLSKPIGKMVMILIVFEGFLFTEIGSRMRKRQ